MRNYDKLYHIMFNAVTDALEQISQQNYGCAEKILKDAQCTAEKIYISIENSEEVE